MLYEKGLLVLMSLLLVVVCSASGQTIPETVVTDADVEIRFPTAADPEPPWINGGDVEQPYFSVGPISYSPEPLSVDIKHTTKLNEPETWEAEMYRLPAEPFRKVIFVITLHEVPTRRFELHLRNRYEGETGAGPWSVVSVVDKAIGKTGKPGHVR